MQSRTTNLRSFAFAGLLVTAIAPGCGSDPGTAPSGGAAGRAGTAGKGGLRAGEGGAAGTSQGGPGTGGVLAIGGASGRGGNGGAAAMGSGAAASGAGTGAVGGTGLGGAGGGASGGVGGGSATMAIATVMPVNPGTTSGTATFVPTSNGVRVTVKLTNCPEGRHGLHIHAGDACTSATIQGAHWGPTRGENIGPNGGEISCDASLRGTLTYTRLNPDPVTSWTVGDGAMSDVVGHPLVIQALDGTGREGCGVIRLAPPGGGGASGGAGSGGREGAAGMSGAAGTSGAAGASGAAGKSGSGGSPGSGGSQASSGGSQGSGGSLGTGGLPGSGGSQASSGGAPGSGGANAASGGAFGSGGSGAAGGNQGAAGASAGGRSGSGAAGAAGTGGAGGVGPRTAAALVMPFDSGTISGTVAFVEVPNGVKVTYDVVNCPVGQHPTQIHAGTGCGSTAAQGDPWVRGRNIGPSGGEISCDDTQRGTLTYVRMNDDPAVSWTIGDGSAADILGHPVIIRALNAVDRDACGIIARSGAGGAGGGP